MEFGLIPTILLGIVGVAALGATIWVRIRSSTIEELRAALATARDEIIIARTRAERLEEALKADQQSIEELKRRVSALEAENSILRGAISSGQQLAPEFGQAIVNALQDHEERSRKELRQMFRQYRDEVYESHMRFRQALPTSVAVALDDAMNKKDQK